MAKKRCLAIIGLETITRNDGTIIWSDTFYNNIDTWRQEHPDHTTIICDARKWRYDVDPLASMFETIMSVQTSGVWDTIVYSGHSDTDTLYIFSRLAAIRPELHDDAKFITRLTDLSFLATKTKTQIYLLGCQTAGQKGKKIDDCIAQCIADSANCLVYGYASKTAQEKRDGRYHQKPDYPEMFEFKPMGE